MKILCDVAHEDKECIRCTSLGIQPPTILEGYQYFLLQVDGVTSACCKDCFERLEQEVADAREAESK